MHIERFFVSELAHVSYVFPSLLEAIVVDPERNVDGYLTYLAKNGLEPRYIFLTHPHADFVAGHAELAARSVRPFCLPRLHPLPLHTTTSKTVSDLEKSVATAASAVRAVFMGGMCAVRRKSCCTKVSANLS